MTGPEGVDTVLLPARSVLLSVLLGSHPPAMPVRTLVRTAELFGISEGTARVALSRLSAEGEVVSEGAVYRLSPRHLERQSDQDAALRPPTRPWRGSWVLAVVAAPSEGREAGAAPALGRLVQRRRLAELRPGVWTRPDNLRGSDPRPALWGSDPDHDVMVWFGRPAHDATEDRELVRRLWDLDGWAHAARALIAQLEVATEPAVRLSVAAAMVRHLRADPVLPPALLPPGWPGQRLRRAYASYRTELGRLIAGLRDG